MVLPPKYPLYLLDTSELTDYFSLDGLLSSGVPVISFLDFVGDVLGLELPGEFFFSIFHLISKILIPLKNYNNSTCLDTDVIPHSHPLWRKMAEHERVTEKADFSIAGWVSFFLSLFCVLIFVLPFLKRIGYNSSSLSKTKFLIFFGSCVSLKPKRQQRPTVLGVSTCACRQRRRNEACSRVVFGQFEVARCVRRRRSIECGSSLCAYAEIV